ncbi:hypothetical protein LWI29_004409 [Acer saccharum]|uniref:Homeobox domain-containing protein n=1 Tax=Acer saccharum TaxID=4024 RepID=A0AA39S281_ACESA|nr:hypothetical protein LWI29_004409 [Acer saccharum]KAK1563284.1 hypothetical protein Q3G72_025356 [Acer saccharum]KAK1563610.1 hypothetical protein Q3G72_029963 [Acer saccharum]
MELALSLGDTSKAFSKFLDKSPKITSKNLGFCMGLERRTQEIREDDDDDDDDDEDDTIRVSSDPPVQLDLLPFSPVPRPHHQSSTHLRFPWLTHHLATEPGSTTGGSGRGLDVNRFPMAAEGDDGTALSSSPNSAVSSFQMEFCIRNNNNNGISSRSKREFETETHERGSDDEENGLTRKKLRLSKEQSAFLEESFKEHNTLNPKQKLALAKQLNLRPRQVEVWFQNRRARNDHDLMENIENKNKNDRTKLKQTEVDCEYLKRCCETLTEENRRLQKELQELRALKTSQPFYMQLPATTLTMCPSCERVATTATTTTTIPTTAAATTTATASNNNAISLQVAAKPPRLYPFGHVQQVQPNVSHSQAPQSAS